MSKKRQIMSEVVLSLDNENENEDLENRLEVIEDQLELEEVKEEVLEEVTETIEEALEEVAEEVTETVNAVELRLLEIAAAVADLNARIEVLAARDAQDQLDDIDTDTKFEEVAAEIASIEEEEAEEEIEPEHARPHLMFADSKDLGNRFITWWNK
jgi:AcrR family transcriptional regulator